MRQVLLAALLVGACTPSAPVVGDAHGTSDAPSVDPNEGAKSGSRLKLTWFNFADGTRTWNAFYDAQRKENCSIYEGWADGGAYCVPENGGTIAYSDAGCTQKVIEVYQDPNCPGAPTTYALDWSYTPCTSSPSHLYQRGAQLALANYYYKYSDGSCGGPFTTSGYSIFAVGAEVPTTDLVKLSLGSPTGGARLSERFYQSADGMQIPWLIHDAMLGVDCYPAYTPDNAPMTTCAPGSAAYASYYHDASCSQPELEQSTTCSAPQYAVSYPTNACPDDPGHYYAIGPTAGTTPLYFGDSTSCTATTGSTGYTYYTMGQQLSLAPVMRTIDAAAGHRVQLVHYTTPDGLKLRDYSLFDSQQGASCYPTQLPDGTIRCVPYGGYADTFYTDAACTNEIDLVAIDQGVAGCPAPQLPKFARKYITPPPGTCTYTTEVHLMSTPYAGTVYQNYGTCTAYNQPTQKLFTLGPPLDITSFVLASLSTDN